jgi:hypothetical protein
MTEGEYRQFKSMRTDEKMRFLHRLYLNRVERTFTEANFKEGRKVRPPKERMTYKIEEAWVEQVKEEYRGSITGTDSRSRGIDDRFPNLSQWPKHPTESDIRERNIRNRETSDDKAEEGEGSVGSQD